MKLKSIYAKLESYRLIIKVIALPSETNFRYSQRRRNGETSHM